MDPNEYASAETHEDRTTSGGEPRAVSAETRCTRCILPAAYPGVDFDESGTCAYCRRWSQKWEGLDFGTQAAELEHILATHRGATEPYDCLIGLSGGKDSVYAAYLLKQHGMTPLACTFDNGFLTDAARRNIASAVSALGIGHVYVEPDPDQLRAMYRHFLGAAGEFCSVCNVGIRSSLYRTAEAHGIKLIVSGQSNRTEANSPKEFFTCSNGYFANVARGAFPSADVKRYMHVTQAGRVVRHLTHSAVFLQLPSYVPWREEEFKRVLASELGWEGAVGEQHADCTMSDAKEYLKLEKFGVTEYAAKLSSLVRDGQLTRDEALLRLEKQVTGLRENAPEIRERIQHAFGLSADELDASLRASHLPYLSKTDARISAVKNAYERLQYRRSRS